VTTIGSKSIGLVRADMKYYIECDSYYACYREADPDNWDNGEDGYSGHTFRVSTNKVKYPDETFETELPNQAIIAVIYSDGNTFGRTDGLVGYVGPFELEKAKELAEYLANDLDNHEVYDMIREEYPNFIPSWGGFFAHIQDAIIVKL